MNRAADEAAVNRKANPRIQARSFLPDYRSLTVAARPQLVHYETRLRLNPVIFQSPHPHFELFGLRAHSLHDSDNQEAEPSQILA